MSDDPASKGAFRWEVARGLLADLRQEWPGMGEMANEQRRRAASAIEELMATVEAWQRVVRNNERDIAALRKAMIDVNVRVEVEADRRRNPKSGNDMTTLSAVKVVTEFVMTPEFLEEAHRGGFQYQALGTSVESSLRNAVEKAKGMDILSLASFHPMRAR